MSVVELKSTEELNTFSSQKEKVVCLYFWADWCEPCKAMDKVVEELAKMHTSVQFCRVEAEAVDEITEKYEIESVPTFIFIKGGQVDAKLEGADSNALTKKVATYSGIEHGGVEDLNARLKKLINQDKVMLFMKGLPSAPRCGFSAQMVKLLDENAVKYSSFDILSDEEVRQGLKKYSNWPTYPQLYVKGELIGGLDIVKELNEEGELKQYAD